MIQEEDPKRLTQIALVALLIVGCIAVLLPFIGAVLFAFVVWICTWTFYASKLLPRLGEPVEPGRFDRITPWWRGVDAAPSSPGPWARPVAEPTTLKKNLPWPVD